jgi:indolepyruvate ferredoxin oxidoreductase
VTDLDDRREYQLADRYRLDDGRAFASGVQAAARLPVEQLRADRRVGLRTAAFVSGYPGSPLAGFDREVAAAARTQPDLPVVLRPALNEELAATAVMGSQLTATLADALYDGVVGIWYGKAPGLDRASDALRHAVFAGSSATGGAVVLVGDDPAAKSSTLPSSSDATLVSLHMPILFPGDVQDVIDLGRHAVHLSRASGLWTSVKLVAQVADGTGTIELAADRIQPLIPTIEVDGRPFVARPSGRLLAPDSLAMEREFVEIRSELARRYGVDNHLNRVVVHGPSDWIGIAASGHTFNETVEALRLLGLHTHDQIRAAGVRLLQLRMPVPLDPAQIRSFAEGLAEVVVVEEKNPTLELLVKDALYSSVDRPTVVGKRDPAGDRLLPGSGTLDADTIATALRRRLSQRLGDDRLAPEPLPVTPRRPLIPLATNRTPFFCSGCPHNVSTQVPDGTLLGAGIGCHSMVLFMEPERVGELAGLTAMGNEGAQWLGMEPFIERDHIVQNLGDGTYFHSGMLAVRAAVAAGSHLTYKLLYNGTVAMTGGQDPQGQLDVPTVVQVLLAEGVAEVLITTDDLGRYDTVSLPASVRVWHRDRLIEAQERLRDVPGVTVLIHDQRCAAETRRDRKRGVVANPGFRVVIDDRVCEGCGDCGAKSNCLSVQPIETLWGRKTRIDQTSCNLDMTCLEGDCPSFATVRPRRERWRIKRSSPVAAARRGDVVEVDDLPTPTPIVGEDCAVRMSGIGGTGVVTVSQVIGTAAMLDGLHVRGLDQTGLSQKAGPVVSDLRISATEPSASNKATIGGVDCELAFDLLVASGDAHLVGVSPDRTVVVGSTSVTPTGTMVQHPDLAYPDLSVLRGRLDASSREDVNRYVDAAGIDTGLFGDATTANVFVLGVAVQIGALPVRPESIETAIELNGVAVARNRAAFRWGRRWAVDPAGVEQSAGLSSPNERGHHEDLDALVDRLAHELVDYQGRSLAERFRTIVGGVRTAELAAGRAGDALTRVVAENLFAVLAYKDEYEVARLLLRPEARRALEDVGGPGARVTWHLHPPMLRSLGLRRKLRLGSWARPALLVLRGGRRFRGSVLDPLGWTHMRREERAFVREYSAVVERVVADIGARGSSIDDERWSEYLALAELPQQVRGYESLKLERLEAWRAATASSSEKLFARPPG